MYVYVYIYIYMYIYIYAYAYAYTYILPVHRSMQLHLSSLSSRPWGFEFVHANIPETNAGFTMVQHVVLCTHGSFPIGLISNWARF